MTKISQYASDTAPSLADYLIGVEASGPTTKRYILSDLLNLFLNNIPAAEGSFGFVSSGMVWSGDAYASTRAASMTSGRVKVNTTFLSISGVTARIFTASVDTYVDVLDNGDGSGTLVYTEVSNNAASPALAANSTRIAIIITGASNIANVGSINQGQENKILPIASSIAYTTTDSLGNLICSRDPNRQTLGYKQYTSNIAGFGPSDGLLTGLSCPVIIPTARKIKVTVFCSNVVSGDGTQPNMSIWEGTVGSGTRLNYAAGRGGAGTGHFVEAKAYSTPSSSSKVYNAGGFGDSTGATFGAGATNPMLIKVELD